MIEAGTQYRWRFDDSTDEDERCRRTLADQLGIYPVVAQLLQRRGVVDTEAARPFLQPKLTALHDPTDLPGMTLAVERIHQAVRDGQPIVIYGDYDVDGITASAILWHTFKTAGAEVHCYIPHRLEEGYGLNVQAIRQIAAGQWSMADDKAAPESAPSTPNPQSGIKSGLPPLIVSVDCGISAFEPARAAKEAGVDLIITDHHELADTGLPEAFAHVHPRLDGSRYPFGYLCGAGVAFKLAWQFAKVFCGSERLPQTFRDLLMDLLSLAALGTVADVVPLVDENRIITAYGLAQIKRTRFPGLNALIDAARLREEKISAFHVGFVLGPRLNASGRMGHAREAVHLLTGADEAESVQLAVFLTRENERRRVMQGTIFEDAQQMLRDAGYDRDDHRAIVLCKEGWHAGVLGVVAARLVDCYARPVVVLSLVNGEAHGSARSVEGVALHETIGACAPLLNSYGGHAMAAGLRLDADKVDEFRRRFTEHVNTLIGPQDLVSTIDVDAACTLEEMSFDVIDQILRLAPFGRGNPNPLFCLRDVQVDRKPQRVGSKGLHLRLPLRQRGRVVHAIGFGLGELADNLAAGVRLDVVFEPKLSTWQGQQRPEYHIKDLKRTGS